MKKDNSDKNFDVIKDQKHFFNLQAKKKKNKIIFSNIDSLYSNKEINNGLKWLNGSKKIIDYGCGEGTTIDYLTENIFTPNNITGVDISDEAILNSRKKYPNYDFKLITDNNLQDLRNDYYDACYLIMVLHHSHNHEKIFSQVKKKLKPGGKFFICDLSSNNIFVNIGRLLFKFMPNYVKKNFENEDLVIDGRIPEKFKVDIKAVKKTLESLDFKIVEVEYGHVFVFLLNWLDKFIPILRFFIFKKIYKYLWRFENMVLKTKIGKRNSEVFSIKCIKQ